MTARIEQPYLLVLFSLLFHVDADGRRWIHPLWAKDLARHADYIGQLSYAAPATREPPPPDFVAMDASPALASVRCVDLPLSRTRLQAILHLPRLLAILWREVGCARIVHTAMAGWPFPEAWLLLPIVRLRGRTLFINVESTFWRVDRGERAGIGRRLSAGIVERLNRWCVAHSDLSTFTHEGYKRSLTRVGDPRAHVVEASWIDEHDILQVSELPSVLAARATQGLRAVFAGRLLRAKGILVLIEAVALCRDAGLDVVVDCFGDGELEDECRRRIAELDLGAHLLMRGTLPYDRTFFAALRPYHAMIVPSVSDEQPRNVFDAYSQALPVIASRTAGLQQCVEEGRTGVFFEAGNALDLKRTLERLAARPELLAGMAAACLDRAWKSTHACMHEARRRLIIDAFPGLANARPTEATS